MKFNPQPKPEPKPKKEFGYAYWNSLKKKSHKKKQAKMNAENTPKKDADFYKFVWDNSDKHCAECGKQLYLPKKGDARNFIHHILPKKKGAGGYPYFRHEPKNVILLCWSDHQKAESAISFPKMGIYPYCQAMKKELMNRFKP